MAPRPPEIECRSLAKRRRIDISSTLQEVSGESAPSPEKILAHTLQGIASTAALGAAATHSLFTHIEKGAGTVEEIARAAAISVRGAQALLDAMVALELVQVADGRYRNSPEASFYLVEGKPAYLGSHAKMVFSPFGRAFLNLPEVAKTGVSEFEHTADVADNPFWEELVLAIVPLALPVTHVLIERLDVPRMASPAVLDIGGGSGIFSVALLAANKTATATQIDWAAVNRIGERFVARHGVGDRFRTIDGDFHTTDLGEGVYDVIIYSNIAHQESSAENGEMFRKASKALKPGGALVISDFVLNDDRTPNHPWTGIFSRSCSSRARPAPPGVKRITVRGSTKRASGRSSSARRRRHLRWSSRGSVAAVALQAGLCSASRVAIPRQ